MLGLRRPSDRAKCAGNSLIQQLSRSGSISSECAALAGSDSRRMKKVLFSGLPEFVDSEALFCFLEENFGPVLDAVVLPFHSADGQRGRFGIVTFRNKNSFLEATRTKSGYIYGKRTMIDVLDARVAKDLLPQADDISKKEDAPPASLVNSPSLPPWAQRFRDWLPGFLTEVSKRLEEGESYPLCSLKGDFRATCGLEIDHTALGFEKLSDFIRAWPEICEPKVEPVGLGPATHVVLKSVPPATTEATRLEQAKKLPEPRPSPALQPSDTFQDSLFSRNIFLDNVENIPPSLNQCSGVTCKLCKDCAASARWFAIPCGHLVLCDLCKESVDKCAQTWSIPCLVCCDAVETWIA
ncbi:hypothetical protein SELMODRAFT_429955 [Selaginella moellendorffii]|uniref:RRM domain-containing protein n=1 Tax=Selaginella moellendorffii TaxID=88036 RepID=D8T7V9_SELML|nr:uncharacterized protein LOC9632417 [Selaginella moellendorffii]EFJ07269.1 hypothetical protein SELMODRAFT_429955 [Selaginella moellendorffii]|eukprot:XP_002991698.1 uncharacterized protein LOC9632417 [Selaginella moellendorffii]